jgi:hypothetical protein
MDNSGEILIDDIVAVGRIEGDIDKVMGKMNEMDSLITKINKHQINIGSVNSYKELQKITTELTKLTTTLSKGFEETVRVQKAAANATKSVTDAYGLLKKEVADAERYLKNMATIYGQDSKQALEAANSLFCFKEQAYRSQ